MRLVQEAEERSLQYGAVQGLGVEERRSARIGLSTEHAPVRGHEGPEQEVAEEIEFCIEWGMTKEQSHDKVPNYRKINIYKMPKE